MIANMSDEYNSVVRRMTRAFVCELTSMARPKVIKLDVKGIKADRMYVGSFEYMCLENQVGSLVRSEGGELVVSVMIDEFEARELNVIKLQDAHSFFEVGGCI